MTKIFDSSWKSVSFLVVLFLLIAAPIETDPGNQSCSSKWMDCFEAALEASDECVNQYCYDTWVDDIAAAQATNVKANVDAAWDSYVACMRLDTGHSCALPQTCATQLSNEVDACDAQYEACLADGNSSSQ